jgi:hypothetical protein
MKTYFSRVFINYREIEEVARYHRCVFVGTRKGGLICMIAAESEISMSLILRPRPPYQYPIPDGMN